MLFLEAVIAVELKSRRDTPCFPVLKFPFGSSLNLLSSLQSGSSQEAENTLI